MISKSEGSKAVAEAIGTFAIVFMGCGSVMVGERFPGSMPSFVIPLVFGLVVAAMIYAVGHISGAHFNPAVTAAFALARRFPWKQVIIYWLAQLTGALTATGLLFYLFPGAINFGATVPAVPVLQALIWEIVLTFFLMFVIIAVATDTRAVGVMAGAAIGATVTFDAFVGGAVTGASMNPARSIGPALAQGTSQTVWLYVVGPVIGAILAAKVYEFIRCEVVQSDDSAESNIKDAKGCC